MATTIADMIRKRSQDLDIPIGSPPEEIKTEDQKEWEKTKKALREFPANIHPFIQEQLTKKTKCKVVSQGICAECKKTMDRTEFTLASVPHRMELFLYECPEHGVRNAQYVAYSSHNTVYTRKIYQGGSVV